VTDYEVAKTADLLHRLDLLLRDGSPLSVGQKKTVREAYAVVEASYVAHAKKQLEKFR